MNALVRALVVRLHRRKWLLLLVLALLMLIPGALTGAGVVSVLVVGGLVAAVLRLMGLSEQRAAAFVFMLGILSAVAPPINVWAMLMAAGANMPYVGFDLVLLPPVLLRDRLHRRLPRLGRRAAVEGGDPGRPAAAAREDDLVAGGPAARHPRRARAAGEVRGVLAADARVPADLPDLRRWRPSPSTRSAGRSRRWLEVVNATVEQVFPLVATMVSVGVLVNILAATGVRGLIAISFIGLPILGIYLTSLFVCPMAQGSLGFGSAVILGHAAHLRVQRRRRERHRRRVRVQPAVRARRLPAAVADRRADGHRDGRLQGELRVVPEGHGRAVAGDGRRRRGDAGRSRTSS